MKEYLINKINEFVFNNSDDYFDFLKTNAFKEPIVKFASSNDSMFMEFKEIIGDFHLTPTEAYDYVHGRDTLENGTVIAIALPLGEEIKESNKNKDVPSDEWILFFKSLQPYLSAFTNYIEDILKDKGYDVVNPAKEDFFKITENHVFSSNWSLKHIAHACGLGTFGLNGALITEKGRSIILLSFVTNLVVEADSRPYNNSTANCLYFHNEECKECIEKCPVDAISDKGIDKIKCYEFTISQKEEKGGYGCGLCLVDVPCEDKNPVNSIKN